MGELFRTEVIDVVETMIVYIEDFIDTIRDRNRSMSEFQKFIWQDPQKLLKNRPELSAKIDSVLYVLSDIETVPVVQAANRFLHAINRTDVDDLLIRSERNELLATIRVGYAGATRIWALRLRYMSKALSQFLEQQRRLPWYKRLNNFLRRRRKIEYWGDFLPEADISKKDILKALGEQEFQKMLEKVENRKKEEP